MNISIKKIFFICLLLLNTAFGSNNIKISIIERITNFIEWPELQDKFIIGIYQNEELKNQMNTLFKNKKIQKLPIEVFNIKNYRDKKLKKINLLYFTKESSKSVDKILNKIHSLPIFVITDFPNDVYHGMHLGLFYKNKRIKFVINKEALERVNLKASYKILKLSKVVKNGK